MSLCFILSRLSSNSCVHADVGPVRPVVRLRVPAVAPAGEAAGRVILCDLDVVETLTAVQE